VKSTLHDVLPYIRLGIPPELMFFLALPTQNGLKQENMAGIRWWC